MLAIKWYTEGAEQKPGFLVVGRGSAHHHRDAWNHFGWVSIYSFSALGIWQEGGKVERE